MKWAKRAVSRRMVWGAAGLVLAGALVGCSGGDNSTAPAVIGEDLTAGAEELAGGVEPVSVVDVTAHRTATVRYDFPSLPALGVNATYEGWLIVEGKPVSIGTITGGAPSRSKPNFVVIERDLADRATGFMVTVERSPDSDPEPSGATILATDLRPGVNTVTGSHKLALGTDFCDAKGEFILATPTSASRGDEQQGIWWTSNGTATLSLPPAPDGWRYEGWVVVGGQPLSTGKFDMPTGADDDRGGIYAGPLAPPPFPGQDFITRPINLVGQQAVITLEPEPDFSAEPFPLRILVNPRIGADVAPAQQPMTNVCATHATGTVQIDTAGRTRR
ncbi:MAG TPA: anti-sigma factor [bacterium]|nr:anti-sigma factor [bacterium]